MLKCPKCLSDAKGDEKFCLNCGAAMPKQTADKKSRPPSNKQNSSDSKKKIGIISGIILLILIFASHFIIKSILSPEKQIAKMQNAFVKEQAKSFLNEFTYDKDTKVDENGFYAYIDHADWPKIRQKLTDSNKQLEEGQLPDTIKDQDGNKIISIVKEDILGGLYYKVKYMLHTTTVRVKSDLTDVQFVVDDQSATTASDKSVLLGKFLPGKYHWTASIDNVYGEGKFSGSMNVKPKSENKFTYTPKVAAAMVSLSSDLDNSTVFINNKTTKKTVTEINDAGGIGPIPLDNSVSIYSKGKNDDGNLIKSSVVKVSSEEVNLPFKEVQQAREEAAKQSALEANKEEYEDRIREFYEGFRSDYQADFNDHDYYYLEDYFYPTSTSLIADFKEYLDKFVEDDQIELGPDTILSIKAISPTEFELIARENGEFTSSETYETEPLSTKFQKYIIILDAEDNMWIKSRDELSRSSK